MEPLATRGRRAAAASALALGIAISPAAGIAGSDTPARDTDEPFAGAASLDRRTLVAEVLRRNPSASAALTAWRAAQARVPQETALEDPMLTYGIAPLSVASSVSLGQTVQVEQRFPWPGRLRLAGEVALAKAAAAREAWRDTQLRLAVTASTLFDDWYVVHRALEINSQHIQLVQALKKSAEAQYVVGEASQQDALQAESELAHLEHDAVVLSAQREVVRAQINGLLHRPPQAPLAPPPATADVSTAPPGTSEEIQAAALSRRPDLAGMKARLSAREASVALAVQRYYPDLGLMASYNSMWMETPHQLMVGVSINLPISLGKRGAAVDEARAARARAGADLARSVDDARVEVETARQRLLEALHVHQIFQTRLVPVAKDRISAARAGFETGSTSFLAVMEAERNLRTVSLEAESALANVERRRAELDRVMGVLPAAAEGEGAP